MKEVDCIFGVPCFEVSFKEKVILCFRIFRTRRFSVDYSVLELLKDEGGF